MNKVTLEDGECRMCGNYTKMVVNVNFKAISICDNCCDRIVLQHIPFMISELDKFKCRKHDKDSVLNESGEKHKCFIKRDEHDRIIATCGCHRLDKQEIKEVSKNAT